MITCDITCTKASIWDVKKMKKLMNKIEKKYGFHVHRFTVVKDKPLNSFVAKIETSEEKEYAVKTLYLSEERQRFIVETEKLLSRKGLKIAKPVRTKNEDLYFIHDDTPYVLYEWINGHPHPLRNTKDFLSLIQTAARLHHSSRELKFRKGTAIYSNKDLQDKYANRLCNLDRWYKEHQSSSDEKIRYLLQWMPYFLENGKRALDLLKKSNYHSIVSRPARKKTLVHGDLNLKNVLVNEDNEVVLFDFEEVHYDIPSQDLFRLYMMYMKIKPFSEETFDQTMDEYRKVHSISSDIEKLIYIDFYFPNTLEHTIRKQRYEKMDHSQLEHYMHQEQNKTELMKTRLG